MSHTPFERALMGRAGLGVTRFHTMPTVNPENVGKHSAGVALLMIILLPDASPNMLKAAITHDLAEYKLGDVPAQVKWQYTAIASAWEGLERGFDTEWEFDWELNPLERVYFQVFDVLDFMLFALEQRQLGNAHYEVVFSRGAHRAGQLMGQLGAVPAHISQFIYELNEAFHAQG